ncbi:NTA1 [Candida jiufengensis]|uniref:NTA1 n=1 Tax=Candida jiufengensis TaxID=497108 RepID=UPI00222414ED|nr:NTA1 [Candida jiufengensis]KAI5951562.1 NTA1 [Candida jiufengensis]
MKLKVAIVQINSILGSPKQNITKIQNLLSSKLPSSSSSLDLIVLSELAITGYNFKSSTHIKPYLESPTNYGTSLNFAKSLSLKYKCFTIIGYPEINVEKATETIYNSCAVFDRKGELIYNYRKTFLYETDEVWGSSENPNKNFEPIILNFDNTEDSSSSKLDNNLNKSIISNIGICMDLNPYKFEAPFNKFEFSSSCYNNRSKLIICPMAWLSPNSPSIKKQEDQESPTLQKLSSEQYQSHLVKEAQEIKLPNEPNYETINYWILRFFPFLKHPYSYYPKWFSQNEKINVLICNRIGKEDSIIYGGSSCILQFNNSHEIEDSIDSSNSSVEVLNPLCQSVEGIIVQDIDL